MTRRTIKVDYLARVEGEGALHVGIDGDEVGEVRLEIFEPPRFFEAFLRGRRFEEVPDIVARICGICPVAYQMSAVQAVEAALGVEIPGELVNLRRLLYCAEWIESHVLHVHMLHAPDFLGYHGAVEMAKDHREIVERGLSMKKAGNDLLQVIGGRAIHPINVRVGGFHRLPSVGELRALRGRLERARDAAIETVRWTATLECPELERDWELVALAPADEYPMNDGRVLSTHGLDIDADVWEAHFEERHVPHSTALQAIVRGRGAYLTGPLARFALNRQHLAPRALELADEVDLPASCRNPFRSIVVRSVEVVHAFEEALRLIDAWAPPERAAVPIEPRAGTGMAATEAPRGLLYHRYELDGEGLVTDARIVPPTSQNQASIEADLRRLVEQDPGRADDELRGLCEQAIRNHDPCISCSTHFLKLDVSRRPKSDAGRP